MEFGNFGLATAVTALALSSQASAGFSQTSQSNIAVYWGQDSNGQANSQQRLSTYCSYSKLNIILLAFMNGIKTPITNFANAGNNCTVYSGTQLLDCPQLEEDIKTCQTTYSKTIILSLGGATYAEGGFTSTSEAQAQATNIWNFFGPNTTSAKRPFRTAIVDGFDFDFESTTSNTVPFATTLRSLMDADATMRKKYYLTAAPQCPYPDQAMNDLLVGASLDFVMVQFYNNYCGVSSYTPNTTTQNNFNMDTWDNWAKQTSKNKTVKILIGVPANTGAGNGYISAEALAQVISYSKKFSSFGGIMMWDMSQMVANSGFLDVVYAALASGTSSISSVASTMMTSTRYATSSSIIRSSTTSNSIKTSSTKATISVTSAKTIGCSGTTVSTVSTAAVNCDCPGHCRKCRG